MKTPRREMRCCVGWTRVTAGAVCALIGACGSYGLETAWDAGSFLPDIGLRFPGNLGVGGTKDGAGAKPVDIAATKADVAVIDGEMTSSADGVAAGFDTTAAIADGATASDSEAADALADDGPACDAAACNDGLECTVDECDPQVGCSHGLLAGYCLIGGTCWGDGVTSADSTCKRCDAMVLATDWSVTSGCCTSASQCPTAGPCDVPACDAVTGQCSLTKKLGCCSADTQCNDSNACTSDTCDVLTGTCSIVPKSCPSPSPCQKGACDAKSGECGGELKPGYCLLDGACVLEGTVAPDAPCKVCAPLQNGLEWTANSGSYCDDGDSCTFSDICTSSGECKGKAQIGCCTSDADCPPSDDPCKQQTCNSVAGLCVVAPKPGCCAAGACCDIGAHTIQPAGTPCSIAPLSTEYQCNGAAIEMRDSLPGCDGASADGCSAALATQSAWSVVQICGSGTKCVATASALLPTCKPAEPVGSCANACGGKSATGGCLCDASCTIAGDCCSDFMALCGCSAGECCDIAASFPKVAGSPCSGQPTVTQFQCSGTALQKRVGSPTCDGANKCSALAANLVWGAWQSVQTCAAGTTCTTSSDGSSGACKAPLVGTCVGYCGKKSTGTCSCEGTCTAAGDCCADFGTVGCAAVTKCGATVNTCSGACGTQSNSSYCYCDSYCHDIGDCCPDKALCKC